MEASDLVLVQGVRVTRATLGTWNRNFWTVLRPWLVASLGIATGLLAAVWAVGSIATPDPSPVFWWRPDLESVGEVLGRNSLVLALHAMACVAGFIAGSSLPAEARRYGGFWRRVHDRAGQLAIGFVCCATTFSLITQAWVLGNAASTLSAQLGISPLVLLVGVLPHAVPELVALFLPLAAWVIASRRGAWHELLAATFVTVALAIPTLVLSAFVEVYVSPRVLAILAG